ncbi:hypothetical protein PRUPE_4G226500 [Prunus persica]|uniref:Transmembrane protein n=1 Tax=Prunus persica TaxID=3760 RepID=A0A251PPQ9_PRUPE|nr:hypothetical protein PRUPE_4G226500 [Prunus persica]
MPPSNFYFFPFGLVTAGILFICCVCRIIYISTRKLDKEDKVTMDATTTTVEEKGTSLK